MKRVLHIVHTPTFGGPHNQALQLFEPLREHGWDVLPLCPADEAVNRRFESAGIRCLNRPLSRPRKTVHPGTHLAYLRGFAADYRAIQEIIRSEGVDLVQICGLMNFQGALAARSRGVPVVWQLLSTFAPRPIRRACMPIVGRYADIVMTTGEAVAAAHPGAHRLGDRLIPFYPPVADRFFDVTTEDRLRARTRLGVGPDEVVVGTVGNRNWQKGHDHLVRIMTELVEAEPHVRLRIVGGRTPTQEDWYCRAVIDLAYRSGLLEGSRAQFFQADGNVEDYLAGFDLFLMASRAEGVPTALLEALAAGVPVVSTDVGAVREVVKNGLNGFVSPLGDWRTLTENALRLVREPGLRKEFAAKGVSMAERSFHRRAIAEIHDRAYYRALQRRRSEK